MRRRRRSLSPRMRGLTLLYALAYNFGPFGAPQVPQRDIDREPKMVEWIIEGFAHVPPCPSSRAA